MPGRAAWRAADLHSSELTARSRMPPRGHACTYMHTENNSGQNYSESPAIASRALAVSTRARFPMSTAEPQGPVCPRGRPQPSVLLQLRACFSGVDGTPPPR